MSEPIRIFIADDNCLLREGLVSMLAEIDDLIVAGAAASGEGTLEQIKESHPDVVLIDIGMPDKNGIEITRALHRDMPDVKVIILGMPDLTDEIMVCIEAGAAGYVLKDASFEYLVETLRSAHRGETFCSPRMAASLFNRVAELAQENIPCNPARLTKRELEIINHISDGLANKEIATRLFIETQTVKNHIHNILDKLQLQNRTEAVQYARQRNLLKKN